MPDATLDTGALIAIERGDRRVLALVDEAHRAGAVLAVPAGAIAQAWRDGLRQVRLGRFLNLPVVTIVPLDEAHAKAAGVMMCARTGTADVIDAAVVACAQQHGRTVVTSDPGDLGKLDPTLRVIAI